MALIQLSADQVDRMTRYLYSLKGHIEHCPDVRASYTKPEALIARTETAVQPFDSVVGLDHPLIDEKELNEALALLEETAQVYEQHCYNTCPPDERDARDLALSEFRGEMNALSDTHSQEQTL